jgi:DNA-binding transcriptional ArsR family regulator/precorrin-6B methylase 2
VTLTTRPGILDQLAALADPTRARLLMALEQQPLTVSELCEVLGLPQSTVSRHLKLLGDQGWLTKRREGTKHFYSIAVHALSNVERQVWDLVGSDMSDNPTTRADRKRLASVLAARRGASEAYFASTGEAWTGVRRELFGNRFDLQGLLGLLDPTWTVGDLGCGTGAVSASIAPFVGGVVAVDASGEMLTAAREATARCPNVDVRPGALEALPIDDASLDAATLFLVLHHVADPGAVIREAARVLKPGAPLLIVDMEPHDDESLAQTMGHIWFGFEHAKMNRHLKAAGFASTVIRSLPVDPDARGPRLFTAAGRIPA